MDFVGHYSSNLQITSKLPNPPDHIVLLDSQMGMTLLLNCIHQWRGLNEPPHILVLEVNNNIDAHSGNNRSGC